MILDSAESKISFMKWFVFSLIPNSVLINSCMFSLKTTFGSSLMALRCGYSSWPDGFRKDRAKFGMLDEGLRSLQESKSFKLELRILTSLVFVLEGSLLPLLEAS